MFEVTLTGKEHGDTLLIGKLYGILVTDTSARLDDSLDAVLGSKSHTVIEREETVRSEHKPLCHNVFALFLQCILSLFQSDFSRTDTVHLACTDAISHTILGNHDGIGLHMLDNLPCELEIQAALQSAWPR